MISDWLSVNTIGTRNNTRFCTIINNLFFLWQKSRINLDFMMNFLKSFVYWKHKYIFSCRQILCASLIRKQTISMCHSNFTKHFFFNYFPFELYSCVLLIPNVKYFYWSTDCIYLFSSEVFCKGIWVKLWAFLSSIFKAALKENHFVSQQHKSFWHILGIIFYM